MTLEYSRFILSHKPKDLSLIVNNVVSNMKIHRDQVDVIVETKVSMWHDMLILKKFIRFFHCAMFM